MIVYQSLIDTNRFILETNIISKISQVAVKYRFIQTPVLVRFNRYLTATNQYILKTDIIS